MTDNEIKKALECCASDLTTICEECPYQTNLFERYCAFQLSYDALDLINRQQAEIERLTSLYSTAYNAVSKTREKAIKEFAKMLIDKSKKALYQLATCLTLQKKWWVMRNEN